ncbi:hypothetical protein CARUB_v10002246mg [Capsella rubella]|uniref:Uncharacterized protein n=1 Tax=Capsella rubella TaxID=81985 RepID=R0H9X1_9BRAS|nr:late embryogenesis abundant protein At5g17165 [Capsella rubella]EOA21785.1 hypothetical protein CARUB_v10002246mg [Capsella rubella]
MFSSHSLSLLFLSRTEWMAAKSKSVVAIGKHMLNGVRSGPLAPGGLLASRKDHTSAYDKNVEEELQSSKVPDDLINPDSHKYWSPHPQTGVFGPSPSSTTDETSCSKEDSVMMEKAWFRPTSLEDLDKTHHS